jgi:hypothetical protein
MDPKVTRFMLMLQVQNIQSFSKMDTYRAVKEMTQRYAKSTMEDYLWRLLRVLRATPNFPKLIIALYNALWLSVGGRPK